MGMSTYIQGFRDPSSQKHKAMVAAVMALYDAEIYELPHELDRYFGGLDIEEVVRDEFAGLEVDIESAISRGDREMRDDYIIELQKIPEGVTHLRFTNSY